MTIRPQPISHIGIGPMSSQIIEAVYRFSQQQQQPIMLIASKNQIDWDGGYVNNWNTTQYRAFTRQMEAAYPLATVYICRDHCGPGFKKTEINDAYQTIQDDINNQFDLIHVDCCHISRYKKAVLKHSQDEIEFIRKLAPTIKIEVGTDENTGAHLTDLKRIEEEMAFFTNLTHIDFFVCQTGSLIKEINQVGEFNLPFIKKVRKLADKYHLNLKEHNADYLNFKDLSLRKNLIDALNIAPQYGVLQSTLTIQKALLYGIDYKPFLKEAYLSKRWEKWLYTHKRTNKMLCSLIAGHYVFSGKAYQKLFTQINQMENFKETLILELMKNFKMYFQTFS